MQIGNITVWLAFVAGLASFLSPCVLSLVPAYIGYLSGRAAGGESSDTDRLTTLLHGVFFVLGFSVVFILFNIIGFGLGRVLYDFQTWLGRIGGIIIIVFGLHMIGVFRIPFLEYDTRVQEMPDRKMGYLSSSLMGVFFSAGWSPCVGPVLGSIIMLAATRNSLGQAVGLGAAYSAGLGIPFLLAALGIGWVSTLLRRYSKVMRYTEIAMGVLLVIVGVMMIFGIFSLIAIMFPNSWLPDL
ncbi:MAG: cytochrome c biogenesis protein CcdA [Chloroflexi bacterium]|nr:MAG: cytochrome c biogenesis protein CcdA [Chloroflexota bacterium]